MGNPYRCEKCGKFISHKDYGAVTYYYPSTNYSMNVPEPVFICGKCWLSNGKEETERMKQESPYAVNCIFKKEVENG